MTGLWAIGAFVLAAALLGAPAGARQTSAAPSEPSPVEAAPPAAEQPAAPDPTEVIVITSDRPAGMSLREYASEFVFEIGDPPNSNVGYARWRRDICVGVENLPVEAGQFVAERISDIGAELGLRPQGPGCRPNIGIVFAADGKALASHLVETEPRRFRPYGGEGGTTQGLEALSEFASSDAPIRWWQVMMTVDRMGNDAIETPNRPDGAPPVVAGANSLITNSVEDELRSAFVIVDANKIGMLDWRQLADYLAFVCLAQVEPGGDSSGYDSILNVFESPSSVDELTEWDWSYLRALYELDRRLMPRSQRGALARLIARDQLRTETE